MCIQDILAIAAQAWPVIWLLDLARYLLGVAAVVAVLDLATQQWLAPRSVRIRTVAQDQRWRELLRSLRTVVVFSAVGTTVFLAYRLGVNRFYEDPAAYGWLWLLVSFPVLLILHDAWFYWTHRLMHHRKVFTGVHRTHHLSVAPTAWTAYSFSVPEAFVQALFLPVTLLVVPVHSAVVFAWMIWMVLRNVMGHSGTELLPRRWLAGFWGRWMTTTLHHEMHHAHGHANYGLYFTWWDRWCGTEHPEYGGRLAALVAAMGEAKPARGALTPPEPSS
jgi:Delta7-sterol 5-desaturase